MAFKVYKDKKYFSREWEKTHGPSIFGSSLPKDEQAAEANGAQKNKSKKNQGREQKYAQNDNEIDERDQSQVHL